MTAQIRPSALIGMLALTSAACDTLPLDPEAFDSPQHAPAASVADASPTKTPVCHYNQQTGTYYRLDVGPNALLAHLAHGDVLFDEDPADTDPNDGDGIYCNTKPGTNFLGSGIVFASNRDGGVYGIYVMNTDGSNPVRLTTDASHDLEPVVSPDGSRIAFKSYRDGNAEIYVMDADGSNQTRLTFNPGGDEAPAWSPDGTRIAFGSFRDGSHGIFVMNADGSNQIRLTSHDGLAGQVQWSPTGTQLVFSGPSEEWEHVLFIVNVDGSNLTPLMGDWAIEPSWSPDGSRIAFAGLSEDFDLEIYVVNADGSNKTRLTHNQGADSSPAWSPDGSKIAFASFDLIDDDLVDIFVMNADGSNRTRLTFDPAGDRSPAWWPEGR